MYVFAKHLVKFQSLVFVGGVFGKAQHTQQQPEAHPTCENSGSTEPIQRLQIPRYISSECYSMEWLSDKSVGSSAVHRHVDASFTREYLHVLY